MRYMPLVGFKVDQLSVHIGVFKFLVSKQLLYSFDVLGPMIFHGRLPVAQRVKVDLFQSRVLKSQRYSAPLLVEVSPYRLRFRVEYEIACFWHCVDLSDCLR